MRGSYLGVIMGDYEGGQAQLQRALAIAQSTKDRRLELRALDTWAFIAVWGKASGLASGHNACALALLDTVDSPWDEAHLSAG